MSTTTAAAARQVDPERLEAFIGQLVTDIGATISSGLVMIGDQLGLYRAMADGEPVTADELAERTGTSSRYVTPWLANQAAGGYVEYDPTTGRFSLTPEQAAALADSEGPAFFAGPPQLALGTLRDVRAIEERFRTGEGFGWHQHDPDLFVGTERFFRPGYVANLVSSWLPALTGSCPSSSRAQRSGTSAAATAPR